jgi:hypothetical protein
LTLNLRPNSYFENTDEARRYSTMLRMQAEMADHKEVPPESKEILK